MTTSRERLEAHRCTTQAIHALVLLVGVLGLVALLTGR